MYSSNPQDTEYAAGNQKTNVTKIFSCRKRERKEKNQTIKNQILLCL